MRLTPSAAVLASLATLTSLAPLAACAKPPVPLSAADATLLERPVDGYGDLVFRGTVAAGTEKYAVERRVKEDGANYVATEVYLPSADAKCTPSLEKSCRKAGTPTIVQQATHGHDGTLVRFEEIHDQTGIATVVEARSDGTYAMTRRHGTETSTDTFRAGDPLVTGPTLASYVRGHLRQIRTGGVFPVRLLVPDLGRTYDFSIHSDNGPSGTTTVAIEPTGSFTGFPTLRIDFESRADNPIAFHGRLPVRSATNGTVDGDATYTYSVPLYR
jgi:hypothetical protein